MTKANDKLVKDSIKKLNELEEGKWQELVFNLIYLSGTQIVPYLVDAVKKDNYNPDRWNAFGLAFLEHGFAQAAKELFLALLEKDTEHKGRYLNNLGIVAIRIGNFEEAEDYFNQAYKIGVSKVGKKEAKKLPAWINLQRVRRKRVSPEFQIKEGFGQISKLKVILELKHLQFI